MGSHARSLAPDTPLRIVHVAGGVGPDAPGGVGRAVHYLARAQRALGHEVTVVSERADRLDERDRSDEQSPWTAARRRLRRTARQVSPVLVRELISLRPDIVHLHSIHVVENVLLSRHLQREQVRYCVTIHGGLRRSAQRRGRMKKTLLWWLGERNCLDGAAFIHALTRDEASDIRSYGVTAPSVVAANGIEPESTPRPMNPSALFVRLPELTGRRVFMFMGRIAPVQKGLDLLIRGLSTARVPDARLVLLGPDWKGSRASLERLVDDLNLRTQVSFLDVETPQRCADLVAGADVFVHTSRWEGLSLAVLEAAVWKKPCLLTRAADPDGVLGEAGGAVIVEPTPGGIADGLRQMCALDRMELAAMGQRACATATGRFRWTVTARTLIDAYRRANRTRDEYPTR